MSPQVGLVGPASLRRTAVRRQCEEFDTRGHPELSARSKQTLEERSRHFFNVFRGRDHPRGVRLNRW